MESKKYKGQGSFDFGLFFLTILLVLIGIIMVYSASFVQAKFKYGDTSYFLKKEIIFSTLGLVIMLIVSKIDYRIYKKFDLFFIVVAYLLLIVTLWTPLGITLNHATRWMDLGPLGTLMPSEVAKFSCILISARIISNRRKHITKFSTFIQPFIYSFIAVVFIILQPDLSTSFTILFVTFAMLFVAGVPWISVFSTIIAGAAGVFVLILAKPYRMKRLMTFRDPFQDRLGDGYQVIQSLYALASGGVTGLGLGRSRQKFFYLPEPQNDFIFAIIGEELGYIGGIILLILFSLLISKCFKIAMNAPDLYGTMIVAGITFQIGIQVLVNVGVATSAIPNTGIPLPFISYGGTALVIFMAAIGIILNISRHTKV